MKVIFVWLLLIAAACADPVVGWRVPIERFVPGGLGNELVGKLDKAPEQLAFFEAGDELWDVKAAVGVLLLKDVSDQYFSDFRFSDRVVVDELWGGWAVWNARSEMLVLKGNVGVIIWADTKVLPRGQEPMIRTRLELRESASPNKSKAHVSVVGAGGATSMVESNDIRLEVISNSDGRMNYGVDYSVKAELKMPGGSSERVTTEFTSRNGEAICIASRKKAAAGWEMWLKSEVVTGWGTPVWDVRWIEKEGQLTRLKGEQPYADFEFGKVLENKEMRVGIFAAPADFISRISEGDGVGYGEIDPFAGPEKMRMLREKARMKFPKSMRSFDWGGWMDVSQALRSNGVRFELPGAGAGFDKECGLLVVVSNEHDLDMVETILMSLCSLPPMPIRTTLRVGDDQWSVISCSGGKGLVEHTLKGKAMSRFDVTPSLVPDWKSADLEVSGVFKDEEKTLSKVTAKAGQEVEVGKVSIDGRQAVLTAEVEVLRD